MSTTNIVAGNTYTFENLETGKFLNLYAGNTTNGTNVCQYDEDGSDEQKWTFRSDNKLYTNTSATKCLDKYTVSGDDKDRNADIWTNNDDANQKVEFITTGTNYVRIHLLGTSYYLAASAGSSNGANSAPHKEPGAAGNVFWATYALAEDEIESLDQFKWTATHVGGNASEDSDDEGSGDSGSTGNTLPALGQQVTTFPTAAYYSNNNATYALGSGYVGECTWYCNGRAYEKKGIGNICTRHAKYWYDYAKSSLVRRDSTAVPVADSIGCFDGNHVVYIEDVRNENGVTYVYFSECNWYDDDRLSNGEVEVQPNGTDGKLKRLTLANFKTRGVGDYQGCIVL